MSRPKLNWQRVRIEAREHSQSVEWATGRRRFREWMTESVADADSDEARSEVLDLPAAVREKLLKELAKDWPNWKSPLEE